MVRSSRAALPVSTLLLWAQVKLCTKHCEHTHTIRSFLVAATWTFSHSKNHFIPYSIFNIADKLWSHFITLYNTVENCYECYFVCVQCSLLVTRCSMMQTFAALNFIQNSVIQQQEKATFFLLVSISHFISFHSIPFDGHRFILNRVFLQFWISVRCLRQWWSEKGKSTKLNHIECQIRWCSSYVQCSVYISIRKMFTVCGKRLNSKFENTNFFRTNVHT